MGDPDDAAAEVGTVDGAESEALPRLACLLLPGCDAAELLAGRGGKSRVLGAVHGAESAGGLRAGTVAETDLLRDRPVTSEELAREARWAQVVERLRAEVGLAGFVSLPVGPADEYLGALVLYARLGDPLAGADAGILGLLTAVATTAVRCLAAQTKALNLGAALDSNRQIGVATGILMERLRTTEQLAFARLRDASQNRNVKLREIAAEVAHTGRNP